MARTDEGDSPTETQARERKSEQLLGRRSYLKLAGSAVAASGLLASTARQSTAQTNTIDISDGEAIDPYLENIGDGEVLSVPEGTYEFHGASVSANDWTVVGNGATFDAQGDALLSLAGSGWTFGGVEFQVESGNVRCLPKGENWTLENLAWNGPNTQGSPLVRPYVSTGAEAIVRNCWFGDGMGTRVGESAIKANSDGNGNYSVEGDLYVNGCYFYQNTCYAAASAGPGQPGRVHFDSCYFEDAYLAGIRTGSLNGTCNVTNCVINLEDMDNVPETSSGATNSRGIWAYWGEVVVEDTHIYTPGKAALLASSSKGDASITAKNCEVVGAIGSGVSQSSVGSDPSRTPPSGCVTTPSEAATGQDSTDETTTTPDFPNTISFSGGSTSNVVQYEFTVTEQAQKSTARGASIDPEDEISGSTISGAIAGGTDSYEFSGEISSFSIDGNATIYLNGSEVSADSLADATAPSDSDSTTYDGRVVIDGTGHPNRSTTYKVKVDGDVRKSSDLGSINSFDTVENGVISGRVINGKDGFEISGEIVGFEIDGAATIDYRNSQ